MKRVVLWLLLISVSLHGCILEFKLYELLYHDTPTNNLFYLKRMYQSRMQSPIPEPVMQLMIIGEYDKARRELEAHLQSHPGHQGVIEGLVYCHERLGSDDQALALLDTLPSSTRHTFHRYLIATRRAYKKGQIVPIHLVSDPRLIHRDIIIKEILFPVKGKDPVVADMLLTLLEERSCHVKLLQNEIDGARFVQMYGFVDPHYMRDKIIALHMEVVFFWLLIILFPLFVFSALFHLASKHFIRRTTR